MTPYENFIARFKLLINGNKDIITNTLSNIFSMRVIGNKTHGDLAEIAISEFINQFMYDYASEHTGKEQFRKKEHEEDITVKSLIAPYKNVKVPISLKAYGNGPLQISTDKEFTLFDCLQKTGKSEFNKKQVKKILDSQGFKSARGLHVLPLIYDEKKKQCNIMVFDIKKAYRKIERIKLVKPSQYYDYKTNKILSGKTRKHPIYLFLDNNGQYVCEVRYGNARANALQRGFWTHTKNASDYFNSLTGGWVSYAQNPTLVKLFSLALNASPTGHQKANGVLLEDIENIKKTHKIKKTHGI